MNVNPLLTEQKTRVFPYTRITHKDGPFQERERERKAYVNVREEKKIERGGGGQVKSVYLSESLLLTHLHTSNRLHEADAT